MGEVPMKHGLLSYKSYNSLSQREPRHYYMTAPGMVVHTFNPGRGQRAEGQRAEGQRGRGQRAEG